jgi:hypothetical protein
MAVLWSIISPNFSILTTKVVGEIFKTIKFRHGIFIIDLEKMPREKRYLHKPFQTVHQVKLKYHSKPQFIHIQVNLGFANDP